MGAVHPITGSGRSYRIRKQSAELLLASTSTWPGIQPRTYSDRQLGAFLERGQLDGEALAVVRYSDLHIG